MKFIPGFFLACLSGGYSLAQNLVPNPSFEDTLDVSCGIFYSYTDVASSVTDWYSPTHATPMIWSTEITPSCYNHQPFTTYPGPIEWKGSQMPRTGGVMASIWSYTIPTFEQRHYLQVKLSSPMVVGEPYFVEYYVSLADHSEKYLHALGALFSTTPVTSTDDEVITSVPQVEYSFPLSDTAGWMQCSTLYTPDQPYEYITIGNFRNDAGTTTTVNPGGSSGPGNYGSTYFLDDVRVESSLVSRQQAVSRLPVSVFPNPAQDLLQVRCPSAKHPEVSLLAPDGRVLMQDVPLREGVVSLDVAGLSAGLYFVRVRDGERMEVVKVVVE